MDHPVARKRKTQQAQEATVAPKKGEDVIEEKGEDFISNLPEDIKLKILSCLSARAAVQTSLLSSKWRSTWASVPEISVREADFFSPRESVQNARTRFIKFVDVFLYLHKEPILEFKLRCHRNNDCHNAFDRWILHLSSRNELRKLYILRSFNLRSACLYKLPTSIFSCHGLSRLKLHDCHIKLPRGFQGFKAMRVLKLYGCHIKEDDLEKFVSGCPNLVEMEMSMEVSSVPYFNASASLKIHAPKLKKFRIHDKFASLSLRTPCLVEACFELVNVPTPVNGRCNLVEALGSLSEIEVLGFNEYFLAYLLAGFLPNRLPLQLNKLRMLEMDVNLASTEEASLFRALLEISPNLQRICLMNNMTDGQPISAEPWLGGPCVLFMSLRIVVIERFFISEAEIAFLKFILASAPVLEELTIITDKQAKKKKVVFEILEGIPQLSRKLQINFEW